MGKLEEAIEVEVGVKRFIKAYHTKYHTDPPFRMVCEELERCEQAIAERDERIKELEETMELMCKECEFPG